MSRLYSILVSMAFGASVPYIETATHSSIERQQRRRNNEVIVQHKEGKDITGETINLPRPALIRNYISADYHHHCHQFFQIARRFPTSL